MTNNIQLNGVEVSVEDALAALREKGTVTFEPTSVTRTFAGGYGIQIEAHRQDHNQCPGVRQVSVKGFDNKHGKTVAFTRDYIRTLERAIAWAEGDNNA